MASPILGFLKIPRFSEGVVPEAENWVRKNFEEMREVLEPVSSAKLWGDVDAS